MFATGYITENGYAVSFLHQIGHVPYSPVFLFWCSVSLYILLLLVIKARHEEEREKISSLAVLEMVLAILLIFSMNGSYNGSILVVLSDLLYSNRSRKRWSVLMILGSLIFIGTDSELLGIFFHMPSLVTYISYFPPLTGSVLRTFINAFSILNIALFGTFLIVSLLVRQRERQDIEDELQFVSQVNTELKNYAALSVADAEDNERKRISREIHDTLGHALTGIAAGIDACIVLIDIDPKKTKEQLQNLSVVVREGIRDVRKALNKLRPGVLETAGFKDALEKMIHEFEMTSHVEIDFFYGWDNVDLQKTTEDIIYRIIQESITNSVRHGHAHKIEVQLFKEDTRLMILIQDDGEGVDEIKDGYGLTQMKERVAIINGVVHYFSKKGQGFRTTVEIH